MDGEGVQGACPGPVRGAGGMGLGGGVDQGGEVVGKDVGEVVSVSM